MPQFQTFIRSRDSALNIQSLILVVFIDATMSMLALTNGLMENVPCTNKTGKILLLIMYIVFLKYIFVENFNTSSSHTSLFLETATIKFGGGARAKSRHTGPRAEGQEKQIPFIFTEFIIFPGTTSNHTQKNMFTLVMSRTTFYLF